MYKFQACIEKNQYRWEGVLKQKSPLSQESKKELIKVEIKTN